MMGFKLRLEEMSQTRLLLAPFERGYHRHQPDYGNRAKARPGAEWKAVRPYPNLNGKNLLRRN
jgi:hypothetical protein